MENQNALNMSLLDTINSPADVKALSLDQLKQLAEEIRQFLISVISKPAVCNARIAASLP